MTFIHRAKRTAFILILATFLMSLFTATAFAGPPVQENDDRVVFGDSVTLRENEVVEGNLVVFGGNVEVPASAVIEGDVAVFGGNVTLDGTVEGDMGIVGGNVNIGATGIVEGDIGLLGGGYSTAEGATIEGEIIDGAEELRENGFDPQEMQEMEEEFGRGNFEPASPPRFDDDDNDFRDHNDSGFFGFVGAVVGNIFSTIASLFVIGLIAWLVSAFIPNHMYNIRDTISNSTPVSFGVGLVTLPVAGLLLLTICLIPLVLPVTGAAVLLGWIVIGQMVGERLLASLNRDSSNFALSTVVGTLVITVIAKMPIISVIPFLGGLFWLIGFLFGLAIMIVGLGAVVLTRFGTRPYPAEDVPFGGFGGGTPRPRRNPNDDLDLGVDSASEEELRAKIREALKEADRPDLTKPDPDDSPTGEEPRKA